jgi:mRNA interferase RelE/StbE
MSYKVNVDRQARKEIKSLDRSIIQRIDNRLKELAINPYNPRISGPVRMGENQRKSRVSDWRIIYVVDDDQQTVIVLEVKHRKRAYPKQ